jgi:cytoskeleton protein RodZ
MSNEEMTASETASNTGSDPEGGDGTAPATGPSGATKNATTPGAMLRHAREALGLSVGDVSTRMRMGVRQIEALERSDYAALPTGTFLRGMVRNYAKAVNVDADAAIRLLEETYSHASVSLKDAKIVVPSQNIKVSGSPRFAGANKGKAIGAIAILLLVVAAAGYWWQFIRPGMSTVSASKGTEKSVPAPAPQAPAASATSSTPVQQPSVMPVSPGVTPAQPTGAAGQVPASAAPAAAQPVGSPSSTPTSAPATPGPAPAVPTLVPTPAPPPASTAVATVTPAPTLAEASSSSPVGESTKLKPDSGAATRPAGASVLGFTFAGESWVEVVDGRGRTLTARRYAAGESEEISGRAPFSIVVGNAADVRMAYNGREFDLKPHTRTRTARLTLK